MHCYQSWGKGTAQCFYQAIFLFQPHFHHEFDLKISFTRLGINNTSSSFFNQKKQVF